MGRPEYGNWVVNQREGKGKFTWYNGNTYEGDWKAGKRTGIGVFTWINGDVYSGDWVESEMTGTGKLIWCNNNTYVGLWKEGEKTVGELVEAISKRTVKVILNDDILHLEYLHDQIQEILAEEKCTYSFTGSSYYFQYLLKAPHKDGRTRGICLTCYSTCYVPNNLNLMEPVKKVFGGNFFCDCGAGKFEKPCLVMDRRSQRDFDDSVMKLS